MNAQIVGLDSRRMQSIQHRLQNSDAPVGGYLERQTVGIDDRTVQGSGCVVE